MQYALSDTHSESDAIPPVLVFIKVEINTKPSKVTTVIKNEFSFVLFIIKSKTTKAEEAYFNKVNGVCKKLLVCEMYAGSISEAITIIEKRK